MDIIKVENLSYRYPVSRTYALTDVNISIAKGELCAVIGSSGSGKSTLCSALRGFVPGFFKGEYSGRVLVDNKNILDYPQQELVTKIGYVFQNPFTQITGIRDTVFGETAFGLENLGIPVGEIRERVEKTLDELGIACLSGSDPAELSGGQKQKVAIASVLVMEPDILILDEPTSQLDPQGTDEVFEIIRRMKSRGTTVILAEHKAELLAEHADHVVLLYNGRVAMDGPPGDIFARREVLDCNAGLPQFSMLGLRLKELGLPVENVPVTEDEAAGMILKLGGEGIRT